MTIPTGVSLELYIGLACAAAEVLTVLPVVAYLLTGWTVRRDKLFSYLNPDALQVYYGQFPWTNVDEKDVEIRFRKQFHYLYGRKRFLWPILLLLIISSGALYGVARSIDIQLDPNSPGWSLPPIAISALLGAFMWSISDELDRITRRDLGPKDVYGWIFRMLLAVPFGWALSAVLEKNAGVPVAFFIGAFPTQTLFRIGRRLAVQKLALGDQQNKTSLELESLQSVSRRVAEAFQDEGIDTISSLAWADPVDLTIRTNLDFNYVLDCMSQALLWVYFQEKTKLLYEFSLRGSQEVICLAKIMENVTCPWDAAQVLTPEQQRAKATITNVAQVLQMQEAALLTTLCQVSEDPYTVFIYKVWR